MRPITPGQTTPPISNSINKNMDSRIVNIIEILLIELFYFGYNLYLYFSKKKIF